MPNPPRAATAPPRHPAEKSQSREAGSNPPKLGDAGNVTRHPGSFAVWMDVPHPGPGVGAARQGGISCGRFAGGCAVRVSLQFGADAGGLAAGGSRPSASRGKANTSTIKSETLSGDSRESTVAPRDDGPVTPEPRECRQATGGCT
jgi:hypothetical protein